MTCAFEDDVVARFLDGDARDTDDAELGDHVRACPHCARALARSRHLDALVAATSGTEGGAAADRLLARAIAASRAPAPREFRARTVLLAGAAGFLLGLLAMRLLRTGRAPERAPPPPPALAGEQPAAPADMVLLPDADGTARARPRAIVAERQPSVERCAAVLDDPTLAVAVTMRARARALAAGWPAPTATAIDAAVAAVVETAGRTLLVERSAASLLPIARGIVRGGTAGAALAAAARAERSFVSRLRAALQADCADELCVLAARLGDADLDRRLLAICRRDARRADLVARACADAPEGVARAAFLLDLWAAVSRRGDDGVAHANDDAARARAWFPPLPPGATAELLHCLATTRSAEVRARVLLALGARADAAALPALFAMIEAPNAADAALAAYALGCYDASVAADLEHAARSSRRPELLWVARAAHGDGAIRARLAAIGCSPAEIDLLAAGPLPPEQIPAAAALLRPRLPSTYRP